MAHLSGTYENAPPAVTDPTDMLAGFEVYGIADQADPVVDFADRDSAASALDDEQRRIVEGNLPLVISIAMAIARNRPIGSLTCNDLIQEGVLGLMKAVTDYDAARGNTLGTYATPHIRGAMSHALRDQAPMLRTPRNE